MIKFFRRIRQRLLSENKFSKYLIYAIGEIALVIIGILIALNINSRAELKKTEEKIDKLFENVLEELETSIASTTKLAKRYATFDSLHYKVINDELIRKDYKDPSNFNLFFLTTSTAAAQLNQDAYDNLMANRNNIPEKYEQITKDLISLYKIKSTVDDCDTSLDQFSRKILLERGEKYDWWVRKGLPQDNEKEIDFYLNDYRYKNEVQSFHIFSVGVLVRLAIRFRKKAYPLFKDIATILEKPIIPKDSLDTNIPKDLLGTWKNDSRQTSVKFYEKDNRLFVNSTSPRTTHDVEFIITKQAKNYTRGLVCSNNPFYVSQFIKNDSLITYISNQKIGFKKVTDD